MAGRAVGMAANAVIASAAWIAGAVQAAVAWTVQLVIMAGRFVATAARSVASALVASGAWIAGAVATAAAWVVANAAMLGLWGLIIAAIVGAVVLIVANWNTIVNFFKGVWDGIVNIFSGVGAWFANVFSGAWNNIKNIFGAVGGFFRGLWDTIVSIFGKIGSSIGSAIGDAFKTVVNSIIGFAEGTINMFIKAINGAIGLINNIPGVHINTLTELRIPRLAQGGVVAQPTIAQIGEAGAEAVVPLENNTEWIDKLANKINGSSQPNMNPDIIPVTNRTDQPTTKIEINVSGVFATSVQEQKKVADLIAKQLESTLRAKGLKGAV